MTLPILVFLHLLSIFPYYSPQNNLRKHLTLKTENFFGKLIDLKLFNSQQINMKSYFDALELTHFISDSIGNFLNIITLFYNNAIETSDGLTTYVKSTFIDLITNILNFILNILSRPYLTVTKDTIYIFLSSLTRMKNVLM